MGLLAGLRWSKRRKIQTPCGFARCHTRKKEKSIWNTRIRRGSPLGSDPRRPAAWTAGWRPPTAKAAASSLKSHCTSPRDKLLFQEARSRNGFGLLSFCFDANLPQIKENSTVPPAASPAILPLSQNSRTPPKKSADTLRSVADHNAALLCGAWADIVFLRLCSGRAVGRGDERRGTRDGSRLHSPAGLCQTSFSHTTAFNRRSMSKKEVSVYA